MQEHEDLEEHIAVVSGYVEVAVWAVVGEKPETRGYNESGESNSSKENTEQQVTSNETLSKTTRSHVHDARFSGLDGTDETKSNSTNQVGIEHLDRRERTLFQTKQKTEQNTQTLGIIDRRVHKQDLTEIVPHNTTLPDSGDNCGEVIISENHL